MLIISYIKGKCLGNRYLPLLFLRSFCLFKKQNTTIKSGICFPKKRLCFPKENSIGHALVGTIGTQKEIMVTQMLVTRENNM